jgi:hypothetical protein
VTVSQQSWVDFPVLVCLYLSQCVREFVCVCICSSRFEARRYARSVQTIIRYFSRSDGAGYSAAAHAAAASHACVRRRAARPACGRRAAVATPVPLPSCAGGLSDLHVYDPAAEAWTDISAALSGTPPSPRRGHGFTSAGGKLYVHGGWDGSGEGRAGWAEGVGMAGSRRGGATCCRETGGAAGRWAWGSVASVLACVDVLIGAGMVWGGGDAWRTGGRRFACVWQRRRLARAQAPRLGGKFGWEGKGGRRALFAERESMRVYVRAPMHPGHPFIGKADCSWCEHACLRGRMHIFCHVRT